MVQQTSRVTAQPVAKLDAVVSGDPLQMGLEQGAALRAKIEQSAAVLASLEAFRLMKPRWMPYSMFRWISEKKAARALGAPLDRDFPAAGARLTGIAQGAGVSADMLWLLTAMEAMMSDETDSTSVPRLGGCSALAVRGGMSASGEPVIVRNFDYIEAVRPLYSVRQSRPRGGFQSIDFTMAPFSGTIDGVNEQGLCITYDYAYTTDRRKPSAPISIVIADTLQRCGTVAEAVRWITSRPRWGAGILMLADACGEIASLELSSTRSQLRTPGDGENAIFHSNVFWTDHMRKVQVHDDAVYSDKAPGCLRGRSLHESAVKRDERFKNLLAKNQPLDIAALGAIMSDHGSAGDPSSSTICMHSPYWTTTASVQLFPKSRRMRIAFDSACRAQYAEIAL